MEKFVKDNIIYILLVLAVFFLGGYYSYNNAMNAYESVSSLISSSNELKDAKATLEKIRTDKERLKLKESRKQEASSGKVIYEVLGQQFSPEASFGIMFENILSNMQNSGIKIRSIDYNYEPLDDKVLETNSEGYNACELSFVAIGTYTQLQEFFKNLAKEDYISGISEIYIKPYFRDRSILVSRFRIRLYTKTI